MRKTSHAKRREKLARLNLLLVEFRKMPYGLSSMALIVNLLAKIARFTGDWRSWEDGLQAYCMISATMRRNPQPAKAIDGLSGFSIRRGRY